jgi:hypothetical protein
VRAWERLLALAVSACAWTHVLEAAGALLCPAPSAYAHYPSPVLTALHAMSVAVGTPAVAAAIEASQRLSNPQRTQLLRAHALVDVYWDR